MASYQLATRLGATGGLSGNALGWLVSPAHAKGSALYAPNPDACAVHAFDITPSDQTVFSPPTRWLWIGSGGDLRLTMNDESNIAITVDSGTRLLFSVKQVLLGTTASGIIGCW